MNALTAALRRLVRERADLRCEYCLLAEDDAYLPHEPDHVIATKHGHMAMRASDENLDARSDTPHEARIPGPWSSKEPLQEVDCGRSDPGKCARPLHCGHGPREHERAEDAS